MNLRRRRQQKQLYLPHFLTFLSKLRATVTLLPYSISMNFREYRKGNQKWTIQRNWQHRVDKTKKNKTKTKHKMCWTPLYTKHEPF